MSQVAQMLKEIFKRIDRGKIGTLCLFFGILLVPGIKNL